MGMLSINDVLQNMADALKNLKIQLEEDILIKKKMYLQFFERSGAKTICECIYTV
jgi:hypothetical protein